MLDIWNKALQEDKETIMMMDANINSNNWTQLENLPTDHYDVQFKSLVESLFQKIMSQGVSMLVNQPTHLWRGKSTRTLDHFYTTNPEKASDAEVIWTGMSDHALIKVRRYTRKLTKTPRYVKKRTFKDFDLEKYHESVAAMPEPNQILLQQCPDIAAKLFTQGLTRILDNLAPVRNIQSRSNYAPYLSRDTKELIIRRKEAQCIAAQSGHVDDVREAKN